MKFISLALVSLFSATSFAAAPAPETWTDVGSETMKYVYLLTAECGPQLAEVTKSNAYIGRVSYSGDVDSESYTIQFAAFRPNGFTTSESAGIITLTATPIANPPADGSSIQYTCTY
jgi:hypothetical protein